MFSDFALKHFFTTCYTSTVTVQFPDTNVFYGSFQSEVMMPSAHSTRAAEQMSVSVISSLSPASSLVEQHDWLICFPVQL